MSALIDRIRQLRDKAHVHAANNSYSAAYLIEELAALLEESILAASDPTEFDRGFAAGHEAALREAAGE